MSFYSTYEELKHAEPAKINHLWRVFTVPMRNWNLIWCRTLMLCCLVFTVPMRNWNYLLAIMERYLLTVFTVPMRNWNFFTPLTYFKVSDSFYSTYEELKRLLPVWHLVPRQRFYSTYEELKLVSILSNASTKYSFLQYLWGIETRPALRASLSRARFYSTYEELKLWIRRRRIHKPNIVFTVPMRNWNQVVITVCS